MSVMSVRLNHDDEKRIQALARAEDKEKSTMARELMLDGLKYKMMVTYKDGKVPFSKLSKSLGMTLGETIDFLASFGIEAPISYDDYLAGRDTTAKVIQ